MHRLKLPLQFSKSISCSYRALHDKTQLDSAVSLASVLKSRAVVRFRGPDTVKFLQGLLTNDVRKFGEPMDEKTSTLAPPNLSCVSERPMYAALLTPQGRFLYDFFLYTPPRPDTKLDRTGSAPGPDPDGGVEVFADVDVSVLDELLSTLKKYRLRAKVDIENMAQELQCWQRYAGNVSEKSSSVEEPEAAGVDHSGMSSARGNALVWQWFKDPRLDCLGFRGIFPSDTIPPLVEAGKETDEQNYRLWRIENGVAEGSTEIPKGEAIPLEYNLVSLNAISFDKGCYVGQELIARTHHRGVIRKRLLPLRFLEESGEEAKQNVAPGSEVIVSATGKKVGTVTTQLGCRGLGVLRLDEAFKRSGSLTIQGQKDTKVEAIKPDWWPAEWLQEHQHQSAVA